MGFCAYLASNLHSFGPGYFYFDDWDENRYKRTRAYWVFPSITVFIEHTCAVGNCKHKNWASPLSGKG